MAPRLEQRQTVKQQTRKDQQLSKQAQRVLNLFLEGESRHPDLSGIQVLSVTYQPAKQRLSVGVGSIYGADGEAVLAALKHSQTLLRSVVAASLHRKKIPSLSFYYLGSSHTGEETCRFKR